ncbi:MAG: molecular chaperone DnaJ [bacterium]
MAKDYYKILGVSRNASAEEIKKAFRRLAHQHHPDKTGGDEKKFKEINEAYQVLSDSQKRSQYDQFGQTFEQAQAGGGFSGFEGFRDFSDFTDAFRQGGRGGVEFDFSNFGDFSDVFSDFFGMGGKRRQSRVGKNIEVDLTITLEEVARGAERIIELYKKVNCSRCDGSGAEPSSSIKTCPTCKGQGQIHQVRSTILGQIRTTAVCPECLGTGKVPEKKCSGCQGEGTVKESKKIKINIPAGIDGGEVIRFQGGGEAGPKGSPAGDLYVNIHLEPHPLFIRRGADIYTKKVINITQAALGDKIGIETLYGSVKLAIPEGTQSGEKFRLRSKGLPRLRGFGRGDEIVEIIIKTPKNLTKKQKELLKELEKEL